MSSRAVIVALITVALASTGCQVPRFEGPEVQEPPRNFQRQADSHPQRRVFPEHEVTFHTAWVHTDLGGVSLIYIDEHPTVFGMDDILTAHEGARAAELDPDATFGEVEALTIDGRDAWGWHRRVESPRRGLEQVTYTAVVPYDSVSYALEFTSSEPSLKRAAPDTLRTVLSSFGIGRTTYNVPLIAIVFGVGLLLVGILRARSQEKANRLRSINLVTIKKEDDQETPASDAVQPTGPAPRPGPPPPAGPDPDPPDPGAGS